MAKIFGVSLGKKDPYSEKVENVEKSKRSIKDLIPNKIPKFGKQEKKLSPEEELLRRQTISETFEHTLPATNSISPTVLTKYSNQLLVRKFVNIAITTAAVFGILFAGNTVNSWVQNRNLDSLRAIGTEKSATISTLQQYSKYKTDVAGKVSSVATNLTNDVDVQKIVNFIYSEAAKQGITMTSINVKVATSSTDTGSCMPSDPFATNTSFIGCVTVEGNQPSAGAIINFFNSIEAYSGFQDTFISDTTYGSEKNNFTGSFSFTSELFSNRYTGMKNQDIESLLKNGLVFGKPVQETTPTPTPKTQPIPKPSTEPTTPPSTPTPTPTATPEEEN